MKMFDLSDKTAVVTGGSQGLGKAFAQALAKAGANIVVVSRTLPKLQKVAGEIENEFNVNVLPITCDITSEQQVIEMVSKVEDKFNNVDILINNAGTSRINKPPEEVSLKEWNKVINTNLSGSFICAREVGKQMIKQEYGKIVNLASISGHIINKGVHGGAYDCSKLGLVALTKVLATEWAKYNINVNAIAPGYFGTKPNKDFFTEDNKFYEQVLELTPLKRIGEPKELGGLVIFLSSKASDYMTGNTIIMDGGYTIW